jgi:hypothetical protein
MTGSGGDQTRTEKIRGKIPTLFSVKNIIPLSSIH